MMTPKQWCSRIVEALSELADTQYQREVWVEGSPDRASSFVEAVNRLYDDYDLPGFLRTQAHAFPDPIALQSVFSALEGALDAVDSSRVDSTTIGLSEWERIRSLAEEARRLLAAECESLPDEQ